MASRGSVINILRTIIILSVFDVSYDLIVAIC